MSRSPELRNLSKVVGVYSETINARKFKLGMRVVYDKVYISHRFQLSIPKVKVTGTPEEFCTLLDFFSKTVNARKLKLVTELVYDQVYIPAKFK